MALQILNPQRSFGEELGKSLSSGLGRLAQSKLDQLHLSDALKQNNYSDQQIALLQQLPVNQRLEALQSLSPSGRGQAQQQQQQPDIEHETLLSRLNNLENQPQQEISQQEINKELQSTQLQNIGGQNTGPSADMTTLLGQAEKQGLVLSPEQKQKLGRKIQEIYQDKSKRAALEKDVMDYLSKQPQYQQQQQKPSATPTEPLSSGSPFKKPLSAAERIAQNRLDLAERKEARQAKEAAFNATKEVRKEIADRKKLADQNLHDLERLEELEKEGVDTPGYYEFLKRSGLDIPALMNPASEEYQKISTGFLRGAKTIFGGNISNFETEQLLKLIPSLSMSPAGRLRVISSLKHVERGSKVYNQALQDILKENNGTPPLDLQEQVVERAGKKLGAIADQFKKEISKPMPKGQNKAITAVQAGLGELLGATPGVLKTAAKGLAGAAGGALAGSLIPGIGTATGALAGGIIGSGLSK